MSENNWTTLNDAIAPPAILRASTTGLAVPNGGGDFVYAWNTTTASFAGAHGLFVNTVNYAPMDKGGVISGALVRYASGGRLDFAPMLFIGLQGNSVNDQGYLLGLQDSDPGRIVLRKGAPSGSLPDGDPTTPSDSPNLLRRSTAQIAVGEWVHLRLEFVANGGGDAILRVSRNNLDDNPVTAPVWEDVEGMEEYIDDATGINTGSVPFGSGYVGFAFFASNVTRRAAVDHVQITRQI